MADLAVTKVEAAEGFAPPSYWTIGRRASVALLIGDVLRYDGEFNKASASGASGNTRGMATAAATANATILPLLRGFVELGPTFTPGGLYFVSRTAGKMMPYDDLQNGDEVMPAFLAQDADIAMVYPKKLQFDVPLFDGVSAIPTGVLSGNVTPYEEVQTMSIVAEEALSQGDLLWYDRTAGTYSNGVTTYPASKLGASTAIIGNDIGVAVAAHAVATEERGTAYDAISLLFSGSTIIQGQPYIAGATAGTIVPYSDVQTGWAVRFVGLGGPNNTLQLFPSGLTWYSLNHRFAYQAPDVVTLASDTFTDTNGVLPAAHTMDTGNGWTQVASGFDINGNALRCNACADTAEIRSVDTFSQIQAIGTTYELTVNAGSAPEYMYLRLRYTDASNYLDILLDFAGNTVSVVAVIAGVTTTSAVAVSSLAADIAITISVVVSAGSVAATVTTPSQTVVNTVSAGAALSTALLVWNYGILAEEENDVVRKTTVDSFSISHQPIVV